MVFPLPCENGCYKPTIQFENKLQQHKSSFSTKLSNQLSQTENIMHLIYPYYVTQGT